MFAIGDSLREARTRRGLSAADVQKSIRIRERYLTALEEEQWDLLPGEAYTKGFLRTYAEFLGLDGNLYIDEYNTRISHAEDEHLLVPQSIVAVHRQRRSLLPTLMILLVVGAVIAAFAALGMGGGSSGNETAGNTPNAPAVKQIAKTVAGIAATPVQSPKASAAQVTAATVIRASRSRCWLLIRTGSATGPIVYQGVLEQGKSLHFTLHHDLWMRMGAPDGLDISLDGRLVNRLPAAPANVLLTRRGAKFA